MLAGLLCALVLLGLLFVLRVGAADRADVGDVPAKSRPRDELLGGVLVLVASYPLLRLAPWVQGPPLTFWGDTTSHARVAKQIAQTLLPHGWLDSYVGGFPFGHHYPPLGWLLLAIEMRAGLSPAGAIHSLGFTCTLAGPFVLYLMLLRCAIRPRFACMGAAFLGWVSPYNAFVGGYETFFTAGLISQVLALPFCIWLVVATIRSRNRWEAPLAGWLAMASHPQVTTATLVVLGLSLLASARRDAIMSGARTAVATLLAGAALYGQGLATLDIPLGWPSDLGWRQLGFAPARLAWWLRDGDLLDQDRAPVLTGLLAAASLILLLGARRSVNRAMSMGLSAALLLAVSGRLLLSLGGLGALLLSFLQPLRIISLVPPLAAAAIALAFEQAATLLQSALSHVGWRGIAGRISTGLTLLVLPIASLALPSRLNYASNVASIFRKGAASCSGDSHAPQGYDRDTLRGWLASLSGGKLWYEAHEETNLGRCLSLDGIDLASSVPTGTAAAVGAHVGVLSSAAKHLELERSGSDRRAQALGIGYVLRESQSEAPPPGWVVRNQRGSVQLLSQPAQSVGVGCITQRWRGSQDRVRARLFHDLGTPAQADTLLDPVHFTAIDYGPGPIVESRSPEADCNTDGASVSVLSEEPGAIQALVQSPTPVDVVFRVTAFPTWRVLIDGAPTSKPTLVAPGFFSVRVPPGRHDLSAQASLMPGYVWLVALAALATAAVAWMGTLHCRASFRRLALPMLRIR